MIHISNDHDTIKHFGKKFLTPIKSPLLKKLKNFLFLFSNQDDRSNRPDLPYRRINMPLGKKQSPKSSAIDKPKLRPCIKE